jgi:hypothetical protein
MKTENFDDAFKRKFDSLDETSAYSEAEIDKAQFYVNSRLQKSLFGKRAGAILLTTFTGLLIVSLFGLNLFQQKKQQHLTHTIDSLQNRLAHVRPYVTQYKTDTIYITKYAPIVLHPAAGHPSYTQSKFKDIQQTGNYIKSKGKTSVQLNEDKPGQAKENILNHPFASSQENSLKPDSTFSKNSPEAIITSTKNTDTLATAAIAEKPTISEIKENKMLSALKNLHYQVGAGAQFSKWQNGFEVVGAVQLSSRWNFSAGLKIVKIKSRHYGDSAMFHDFQGGDFNDMPPPYQKDTFAIPNNGIRYTLLQLPLTLAYSLPIKNNYSLLMGLGTDLDLYASQDFVYDHLKNKRMEDHKDHVARTPVHVINNLTLSAGLQKQWRGLTFQAGPFISPQLNEVLYKKENLYTGIRFRVLYNFGK